MYSAETIIQRLQDLFYKVEFRSTTILYDRLHSDARKPSIQHPQGQKTDWIVLTVFSRKINANSPIIEVKQKVNTIASLSEHNKSV